MSDNKWFVFPRPEARARLRLFCFPYSGSGAFAFRTWPAQLPAQVEVCAVQLPGRESRLKERPFTRLQPLVQDLIEAILPYLDKPFALFGHSLGAIIAFELARQLQDAYGLTPEYLFPSARPAPQHPPRDSPMYRLTDEKFIEKLRGFDGTPEDVLNNEELMRLLLPVLKADFEVNETYVYREGDPLSCPISVFRGAKDDNMDYDDAAAWQTETTASFTLRTLPGGHFFIHSAAQLFWQMLTFDLGQALRKLNHRPVLSPVEQKKEVFMT